LRGWFTREFFSAKIQSKFAGIKGGYFEHHQGKQAESDRSVSDKQQRYRFIRSAGVHFDRKDPASDRAFQDPQERQPFPERIIDHGLDQKKTAELSAPDQL
jgi:hypothetical protein